MKTVKVIVIDDEFGIREGIRRVLNASTISLPDSKEDFNFELSLFETGEEGVDAIMKGNFDICFLDNKLPGISGTEVLEIIAEKCENKPLTIMITAFPSVETADAAMRNGAFGFLGKPFRPDELKEVTKSAVLKMIS
jgi:DNA-binding NtrC family response regulator